MEYQLAISPPCSQSRQSHHPSLEQPLRISVLGALPVLVKFDYASLWPKQASPGQKSTSTGHTLWNEPTPPQVNFTGLVLARELFKALYGREPINLTGDGVSTANEAPQDFVIRDETYGNRKKDKKCVQMVSYSRTSSPICNSS